MVDDSAINNNLIDDRRSNSVRVQIVPASTVVAASPASPLTLSHLPQRPAVDLAFHNLSYRVKEGRKNSE